MAGIRKGREFGHETAREKEGSTVWHDIFERSRLFLRIGDVLYFVGTNVCD